MTFGEGYHNYHHTFANDYRNGIRWYHFDPTKWLIWALNSVGLAHGLKRVDHYHIKERLVTTHKTETLEKIQESFQSRKEELTAYISKTSETVISNLGRARKLVEEYTKYKQTKAASSDILKQLKSEIKVVKKNIREDWKACQDFSSSIMKGKDPVKL